MPSTDLIGLVSDGGPLVLLFIALWWFKGYIEAATERTARMAEEKVDRLLDLADRELVVSREEASSRLEAYTKLAERTVTFMTKICERMEADRSAAESEHKVLADQHGNLVENQRIIIGAFDSALGRKDGR